MHTFNIAGPCDPGLHYMVPAEARTPDLRQLLAGRAYFAVHAPRQSGKTTAMLALAKRLTAEGKYAALHFSCEGARTFRDDEGRTERQVWEVINKAAREQLPEELRPPEPVDAAEGAWLLVQLTR